MTAPREAVLDPTGLNGISGTTRAAAAPYADALRRWAALGVERLLVPGHGGQDAVPELTAYFGEDLLRFAVASDSFAGFDDIVGVDPLRFSVDVSAGGLIGHAVRDVLLRDARVYFEVATSACVVGIVPPGVRPDVGRIADALHALAPDDPEVAGAQVYRPPPEPGPRAMLAREAAFAAAEAVPARDAVGRVSADTLAAYPPGIPNLMPGEIITAETVEFLREIGSAPSGLVRGALDPAVTRLRVVR